jgi:hypothetical protein
MAGGTDDGGAFAPGLPPAMEDTTGPDGATPDGQGTATTEATASQEES